MKPRARIAPLIIATILWACGGPSGPWDARPLTSLTAGALHTCGLITTSAATYCWGDNRSGQLGDGSATNQTTPAAVAGGITFASVTAGGFGTCGLTTAGAAYCWGVGTFTPVAVAGGITFKNLTTGGSQTCGLDTAGAAYCWRASSTPVAVPGGITFESLAVSALHACGLDTAGAAYCWGTRCGTSGGALPRDSTPVAVPGGIRFRSLTERGVGTACHTCGVTIAGAAHCWGNNPSGELGDGSATATYRTTPVAVAGERTWETLTAGGFFTCGLTTAGAAYCWGNNDAGQLGDGSGTRRTAPVAVTGGIRFASLTAGDIHTCGTTPRGAAYCWGDNSYGELGDGSKVPHLTPMLVASP